MNQPYNFVEFNNKRRGKVDLSKIRPSYVSVFRELRRAGWKDSRIAKLTQIHLYVHHINKLLESPEQI